MKTRIGAAGGEKPSGRGRKVAQKCPCCDLRPCACDESCLCQDLKIETDDDFGETGFEPEYRPAFLRAGQWSV